MRDSRRKSVACGLLLRYDATAAILSRMLGINYRPQRLYREERVLYKYIGLWDYFIHDRSLFRKDGVYLNRSGKSRFSRVMDEAVTQTLKGTDVVTGVLNSGSAESRHLAVSRKGEAEVVN